MDLQTSMVIQAVPGGVQAMVDWPNSYRWQDGLRVQASSGVQPNERLAVRQLCRNMFTTLLLRAPAPLVRILPKPFAASPDSENRIWEKVRELQGVAGVFAATPGPQGPPVQAPPAAPPPHVLAAAQQQQQQQWQQPPPPATPGPQGPPEQAPPPHVLAAAQLQQQQQQQRQQPPPPAVLPPPHLVAAAAAAKAAAAKAQQQQQQQPESLSSIIPPKLQGELLKLRGLLHLEAQQASVQQHSETCVQRAQVQQQAVPHPHNPLNKIHPPRSSPPESVEVPEPAPRMLSIFSRPEKETIKDMEQAVAAMRAAAAPATSEAGLPPAPFEVGGLLAPTLESLPPPLPASASPLASGSPAASLPLSMSEVVLTGTGSMVEVGGLLAPTSESLTRGTVVSEAAMTGASSMASAFVGTLVSAVTAEYADTALAAADMAPPAAPAAARAASSASGLSSFEVIRPEDY